MAGWEIPGQQITLEANSDLSGHLFKFLAIDGNGQVGLAGFETADRSLQAVNAPLAATVDGQTVVSVMPYSGRIATATYTPNAAITGAASPASRTLAVVNKGADGTGTTSIASLALLGGVNLAANDERALTNSGTATDRDVNAGDVVVFTSTHVGATGLADPGGLVRVVLGGLTGVNTFPVGVLQNKPIAAGHASTVMLNGVTKAVAGGTVAAGDPVRVDASARVITANRDTDIVVGTALEGAAVNETLPVRLELK